MKEFFRKLFAPGSGATLLDKQKRIIIIALACVCVLLIAYFAIVVPLTKTMEAGPALIYDETLSDGGDILIRPAANTDLALTNIKKITVNNSLGSFTYIYDGKSNFYYEKEPDITLSQTAVSSLLTSTGSLTSLAVSEETKEYRAFEVFSEDFATTAEYEAAVETNLVKCGLSEGGVNGFFTVELDDGMSYSVYLGTKIPSGGGYYAYLSGRENVIYLLSSYTYTSVIVNSTPAMFMGTDITLATGNNSGYMVNFKYWAPLKSGERDLVVEIKMSDEISAILGTQYELVYPGVYAVNTDAYLKILSDLSYISVSEIVCYGDEIFTDCEKYGLDTDSGRIADGTDKNPYKYYYQCDMVGMGKVADYGDCTLYFSRLMTDESDTEVYYIYNPEYKVIGKIALADMPLPEKTLEDFVSLDLLKTNIWSICEVEAIYSRKNLAALYILTGIHDDMNVEILKKDAAGEYKTQVNHAETSFYNATTYSTKVGSFEIFREFFTVINTRTETVAYDNAIQQMDDAPFASLRVKILPRDQYLTYSDDDSDSATYGESISYKGSNIIGNTFRYDENGNKIVGEIAYIADTETGKYFRKYENAEGERVPLLYNISPVRGMIFRSAERAKVSDATLESAEWYRLFEREVDGVAVEYVSWASYSTEGAASGKYYSLYYPNIKYQYVKEGVHLMWSEKEYKIEFFNVWGYNGEGETLNEDIVLCRITLTTYNYVDGKVESSESEVAERVCMSRDHALSIFTAAQYVLDETEFEYTHLK